MSSTVRWLLVLIPGYLSHVTLETECVLYSQPDAATPDVIAGWVYVGDSHSV